MVVYTGVHSNENSVIRIAQGVGRIGSGIVFVYCVVLYHKGLVLIVATVMERLHCRAVVHSLNPDETQVVAVQTEL